VAGQQLGRDEAGNIWEIDPQGNPVRLHKAAGSPAIGPAIGNNPLIPGQLAAQGPNIQGQQLQNAHTQQQIQAQPLQNENTAVNIQQGRASVQNQHFNQVQGLRQEFNALPEVKNYSVALQSLGTALKAPNTPQGDLAIIYAYAKAADPGSVVREGEMDMANATASIPEQYRAAAQRLTQGKRLPPEVRMGLIETMRQSVGGMRQVYDLQRSRYAQQAQESGIPPEQVIGQPLYNAYTKSEEDYIRAHGGTPKINGVPEIGGRPIGKADYSGMVGGPDVGLAQMDPNSNLGVFQQTYRHENDPTSAAGLSTIIRNGGSYADAAAYAQAHGFNPPNPQDFAKAVQFARQHNGATNAEAIKSVPTSVFNRIAASPAGAFAAGAGKAMTMGTADEMLAAAMPGNYTADQLNARAQQAMLAGENPVADLAGQIAGGAITGAGINAATSKIPGAAGGIIGARTPMPGLLNRGAVAGDAALRRRLWGGLGQRESLRWGACRRGLGRRWWRCCSWRGQRCRFSHFADRWCAASALRHGRAPVDWAAHGRDGQQPRREASKPSRWSVTQSKELVTVPATSSRLDCSTSLSVTVGQSLPPKGTGVGP
jgi:hypothetical protein